MLNVLITGMVVLLGILSTIGIGFISSCISYFLQWCYKWNFIGQKWVALLRLIRSKIKTTQNKKKWDTICMILYGCIYCQSSWVAIFLTIYLLGFNLIYIIMSIGVNYYFVEKFNKFLYPSFY